MKPFSTFSLVIAGALLTLSTLGHAQGAGSSLTREQVKMERDAFLKIMRWDELTGVWVLKSGMEPPAGIMSRSDVIAMRDKFLMMNIYDDTVGTWVPVKSGPREMSKLTREQVNMETLRFLMMYRYDESNNEWVSKMRAAK
jgi:hypothetical protein